MTHNSDDVERSAQIPAEMAEYLQTFLDETDEQLEDLVETLLALEADATNTQELNEAFRLIHSIKGSAGMMGLDSITGLTHHLESRFERFRSGAEQLDERTMSVVLRSIDFLKQCSQRLRNNQQLGSSAELLDELKHLSDSDDSGGLSSKEGSPTQGKASTEPVPESPTAHEVSTESLAPVEDSSHESSTLAEAQLSLLIHFTPGLQLADLKARLILNRLSSLGEVQKFAPDIAALADPETAAELLIHLNTEASQDEIRQLAEVDGVLAIEFTESLVSAAESGQDSRSEAENESSDQDSPTPGPSGHQSSSTEQKISESTKVLSTDDGKAQDADPVPDPLTTTQSSHDSEPSESRVREEQEYGSDHEAPAPDDETLEVSTQTTNSFEENEPSATTPFDRTTHLDESRVHKYAATPEPTKLGNMGSRSAAPKVSETMRVDINRLDNLMNLAGELVVNRARFQQVLNAIDPAWRKTGTLNRMRDFTDRLRHTLASLQGRDAEHGEQTAALKGLADGIELLHEQCEILENGRRCFDQLGEAMDQLSLVSHSLQRGVLDTRMVPVAPLFNRFKRVVRDLSRDRGKSVHLEIRGEKTELDKRMIDELGDPLVHLVRNSIDHGLEAPEEREQAGKPPTGTIVLEASHSGNNVFIFVRDDGGGIDIEKVKARIVTNGLQSAASASLLEDEQILEFIWHPGFSTADRVSDVSGRGVGMDVVRNRITSLNGTVEVDSSPGRGTTFALRLPLTLAIMECLLVRLRATLFSIPIDDVREIVSFHSNEVISVNAQRAFELRGEYIPLVRIEDVFDWNGSHGNDAQSFSTTDVTNENKLRVVVLQVSGRKLGLQVEELIGSQDIVVKSLSQNFTNISGLSGASILGDGSVCLMLDVDKLIGIALRLDRHNGPEVSLR